MAMPGRVEAFRHYSSVSSFRSDQSEMERNGWTLQSYYVGPAAGWRRMLGMDATQVDAHYLRDDFPTE